MSLAKSLSLTAVAAEFYDLQRSLLHGTYTAVAVAMVVSLLALLLSTR